jgi:hypothetical protein
LCDDDKKICKSRGIFDNYQVIFSKKALKVAMKAFIGSAYRIFEGLCYAPQSKRIKKQLLPFGFWAIAVFDVV